MTEEPVKQKELFVEPEEKSLMNSLPAKKQKIFETNNAVLYHEFRSALSAKKFSTSEENKWPLATLTTSKKNLHACAELKPSSDEIGHYPTEQQLTTWKELISSQLLAMDDLTADILDIISAVWLSKSNHPLDMVTITADDFLSLRGIMPHKGGAGRRGGYEDEKRQKIAQQIGILGHTWIKVAEMEIVESVEGKKRPYRKRSKWRGESVALVVEARFGKVTSDDQIDPYLWEVRPGHVFAKFLFGAGRQTSLLAQKAVEYDPKRKKWEKRLTRYFSFQWRNRQSEGNYLQPFKMETILNAINMEVDKKHPLRTIERFEQAMDLLHKDGVLGGWQYESSYENWQDWLNKKVLVEPPKEITEHYAKIPLYKPKQLKTVPSPSEEFSNELIRKTRLNRGLTLLQAAEQMDISPSRLSRIERGTAKITAENIKKLKKWLC